MEKMILHSGNLEPVPTNFTGILAIEDSLFFQIKGATYKYQRKNLTNYYHKSTRCPVNFEEMFESLDDDEKEIVIWNFDKWK